jgi:hypothetical protein
MPKTCTHPHHEWTRVPCQPKQSWCTTCAHNQNLKKKEQKKKNQINISSNSNSIPENLHQAQCLNNKPWIHLKIMKVEYNFEWKCLPPLHTCWNAHNVLDSIGEMAWGGIKPQY